MNQMRYRLSFGMLAGGLVLLGACALDDGQQSSEPTSTTVSAELVQSCPGYGSCESWSTPAPIGTPYCSYGTGQCGYYCDPVPGRPDYCDQEIIPTDECCNWVPNPETFVTMQSYQWCRNFVGDSCEQIDQTESFVGCGC